MFLSSATEIMVPPKRIISLVPSITELLATLKLDEETIGITKFCVHPQSWFQQKQRIGGTKNISTGVIHQLNPDLIIANKEENDRLQIEELAKHYPVWVTEVNNIESALEMMDDIGTITNRKDEAQILIDQIQDKIQNFSKSITFSNQKVAYVIWKEPLMIAGKDTYINSMLTILGLKNIATENRYPTINLESIPATGSELVFLSSEPYPFKEKDILHFQAGLPNCKIILVDGEMFSWYGSRMLHAFPYLQKLLEYIK